MMRSKTDINTIKTEIIANMIYIVRGHKVMLDSDLASLYGVETRVLIQAVKRNIKRFPDDFMFQLNEEEMESLRSQNVISKKGRGGRRYLSYVFTKQGVAMLSSVLNSERAIQVNIAIMRTFTKLRELIATHKKLKQKIEAMEKTYDKQFQIVFAAIKELFDKFNKPEPPKKAIGFHIRD